MQLGSLRVSELYRIARNVEKTFYFGLCKLNSRLEFPSCLFFYRREMSGVTRISSRTFARIGRLKTEI